VRDERPVDRAFSLRIHRSDGASLMVCAGLMFWPRAAPAAPPRH
jgi:hypothetical protein